MEPDVEPGGPAESGSGEPPGESKAAGCGMLFLKVLAFAGVAIVVFVGLVFGACLFG